MNVINKVASPVIAAMLLCSGGLHAQVVIADTLNGGSSSYPWKAIGGACLTAGDGSGSIPKCSGLAYYLGKTQVGGANGTMPDAIGSGALRFTNGDTSISGSNGTTQTGAVIGTIPFSSSSGVQVTFTSVTYGGNAYWNGKSKSGADGMSFFLLDAGDGTGSPPTNSGGLGGSLGYSCSNGNSQYDGIVKGYIGLGIDEYGNFTNPNDNTATGPGVLPGTISIRGSGNVNYSALSAAYSNFYPLTAGNKDTAVKQTCMSGHLYNNSNKSQTTILGETIAPGNTGTTSKSSVQDYPSLYYTTLPSSVVIYSQQGVSKPTRNAATPISYDLSITNDGFLSLSYSINGGSLITAISKQSITAANGTVPSNYYFGFSAGTGGGSNIHEITCFKAAPIALASDSASVNVQQSARVEAGAQVYLASYRPKNWWGQMTAQSLVYTAATDTVSINPTPNWDASCVLTGGVCPTSNLTNSAQTPSNRSLMTWNGTSGIPLTWSRLSGAEATALQNQNLMNYFAGDRSNEIGQTGNLYRTRTGVLGDIINSSPTWVGPPAFPYQGPWVDLHNGAKGIEGTTYSTFVSNNATRANVVYVGANDGFMHGFRSGGYDSNGKFSTTLTANDGTELIGYAPTAALSTLYNKTSTLNFSSSLYAHATYVDATPGTGDLYYNGAWHTWLVGGLGSGGNASGPINTKTGTGTGNIFALDITDPSKFSAPVANAATVVIGDWSSSGIACVDDTPLNCGNNLGNVYGSPIIRRLHDGNWAVIFGNGLNSSTGTAGVFVLSINNVTGAKTFRFLDTNYGPSKDPLGGSAKNGIAYVTSADLDGDHITDYIYAGDVFGNLWRFDLTSDNAAYWTVRNTPIFSTPAGQPITTKTTVASTPQATGNPKVILNFATGQQFPQTATAVATYATGTQSLYGIWDWDMSTWNTKGSTQKYRSMTSPQTVDSSVLANQVAIDSTQSLTAGIAGFRTISSSKVNWADQNGTQFGWKLSLPVSTEQVIYNPAILYGLLVLNTTIPGSSNVLTCGTTVASGYTMAITPDGGAAPVKSFFSNASNNYISSAGLVVAGIGISATGSPSIVTAMKKPYMINQTASGVGNVTQVDPSASSNGSRLSWIKLR